MSPEGISVSSDTGYSDGGHKQFILAFAEYSANANIGSTHVGISNYTSLESDLV